MNSDFKAVLDSVSPVDGHPELVWITIHGERAMASLASIQALAKLVEKQ